MYFRDNFKFQNTRVKIQILELTTDRKWRSSTGLDKDRFYKILSIFEIAHKDLYGKTVLERNKERRTIEANLNNEEELLFFVLFISMANK